jgi:exosortase family protein XrtM
MSHGCNRINSGCRYLAAFLYRVNGNILKDNLHSNNGLRSPLMLMVLFVCLLLAMQTGWNYLRSDELERLVINEMTVKPAAWLIAHITPEVSVQAAGSRLVAPGGGINILNGCDGMDVVLMLIAAMLVAPIPVYWRLSGILTGSGVIYCCNQLRILALFYSYRADKPLFSLLHGMVAPILLILVVAVFFVLWLSLHNRSQLSETTIS